MKIFAPRKVNRRGALQLSINAVVILILAITMLGLGLTFIRNLFGGTVAQFEEIAGQLDEQQMQQLEQSTQEITFLQSRVVMREQAKGLNFAIYNNRGTDIEIPLGADYIFCDQMIGEGDPQALVSFETYDAVTIAPGQSEVLPLRIMISPNAPATMYRCQLQAKIGGAEDYATKRFEIDYKGG